MNSAEGFALQCYSLSCCLVCLSVCLSVYPSVPALAASASFETSKQRYSRGSLRLFLEICVEFRKNLPFKSYGVKKPICK